MLTKEDVKKIEALIAETNFYGGTRQAAERLKMHEGTISSFRAVLRGLGVHIERAKGNPAFGAEYAEFLAWKRAKASGLSAPQPEPNIVTTTARQLDEALAAAAAIRKARTNGHHARV
jgi:hypothetical protein